MATRIKKAALQELLFAVLSHIEFAALPEEIANRVDELVADFGGCAFCFRPAEFYCDFAIGGPIAGYHETTRESAARVDRLDEFVEGKGLPCFSMDRGLWTCDAPLCRNCRREVGYRSIRGERLCSVDSVDHCPLHVAEVEDPKPIESAIADKLRMRWRLRLLSQLEPFADSACSALKSST